MSLKRRYPKLKPPVAKAEVASNNKYSKVKAELLSVINSSTVASIIKNKPNVTIRKDLKTKPLETLFLNISVSSLPFIVQTIVIIIIATVVIFIPPAVDPEEPPMNISIIVNNLETGIISIVDIVLIPAVLWLIEVNNELVILSTVDRSS